MVENLRIGVDNGEEKDETHHQCQDGIAEPEQEAGSAVAHTLLILSLIGVQHLMDLGRNQFPVGHDGLTGIDEAGGR